MPSARKATPPSSFIPHPRPAAPDCSASITPIPAPLTRTAGTFNPTNLFLTRIDSTVDFNWTNGTSPDLSNGTYTVRWTGQVQPQFSETYIFDVASDDGCRLWVNDQLLIDKWQSQGLTDLDELHRLASRHALRPHAWIISKPAARPRRILYWYSPSQSEEIIPNGSLVSDQQFLASAVPMRPRSMTSALSAVAFLGQPFSFHGHGREHAARLYRRRFAAGTGVQ